MSERTGLLALLNAVDRAANDGHFLVASDFDGTLAPIAAHPADAAPDPRAKAALLRLASRPGITVAVVSGRRRADLNRLFGPAPGVILVGEHGNDYGDRSGSVAPGVPEIRSELESAAAAVSGSQVEVKRHSVAFHYRNARQEDADQVLRRLRQWAAGRANVTLMEGKKILELSVATRNKGHAVVDLIAESGARRVLFVGDDTTDETVFEALRSGDIGVKVGPGDTAAEHRVEDVEAVADLFESLDVAFQ